MEILITEKIENNREYPYLGKSKKGRYVIFIGKDIGVLIKNTDNIRHLYYSTTWFEAEFKPIEATIKFKFRK